MELVSDTISSLESNKQATFNILAYSDIFHYPLTKEEIYQRGKIGIRELEICLTSLINNHVIFLIDGFYCLHQDKELVENRKSRNKRAINSLKIAKIITNCISNLPFIRAVFLSGSISKNCMDKKSDIDFFIVAEPKRLWIAHLFCSIFRRTFLLNRSKYFCFNYIIDSAHLLIDEQSIYTAIEIKTLIPLFGYEYYKKMLEENEWVNVLFPNYPLYSKNYICKNSLSIQKFLENIFKGKLGELLDKWLLNYSLRRRKKRLDPKFFENPVYYTNLQRHIAKSHYSDHYPNIIKEYTQRVEQYTYLKENA